MGRRINISTPTVINTELIPLDESFYLDIDGQTEQWYYDNTKEYAPNRKVTPLLLVPVISVFDKDTNTSYQPSFYTTQWFATEWDDSAGEYVEHEITNRTDSGSADYVIQGNNLVVKKNVSYSHAVTIRCAATYVDPRDSGVTYMVQDNVTLTTSRAADVVFPEVSITSPSGRAYNPLIDDVNSQYEFNAVIVGNAADSQSSATYIRSYKVDESGAEESVNITFGVYPYADIRYGSDVLQQDRMLKFRPTADGAISGTGIDMAKIEKIKGNSYKWNQKCPSYSDSLKWYDYNTNHSIDTNGYLLLSSSIPGPQSGLRYYRLTESSFLETSHKYYISCYIDTTSSQVAANFGIYNSSNNAVVVVSQTTNQSGVLSAVGYASAATYVAFMLSISAQRGEVIKYAKPCIVDLTEIFGAGNEPSTAGDFEDFLVEYGLKDYYDYDTGSLLRALTKTIKSSLNSVEWNQLYDQTPPAITYTHYYFVSQLVDGTRTKAVTNLPGYRMESTEIVVIDLTQMFGAGNEPTTLALFEEWMALNNKSTDVYYPYNAGIEIPAKGRYKTLGGIPLYTVSLPITKISGKLNGSGNNVIIFPDGMKRVPNQNGSGFLYDEIGIENGVITAKKRIGSVDMGTLEWNYSSNVFTATIDDMKPHTAYVLNAKYNKGNGDKSFSIGSNILVITDSAYTDVDTFKNAVNGSMMFYELNTVQEYVVDGIVEFVWYGIENNQEVLADTLPWYVSGQYTDNLVVDAMYGENINVVLRVKMIDGETLSPSKAYATLSWRIPDIDVYVQSDNGGAVRGNTTDMSFDTIVNVNGVVLSDETKQKHLAFNWKIRKNNVSTETDKGWGQRITIDASELRNVRGSGSTLASTLVGNEVYLLGAYEKVTQSNDVVTCNGEIVYDRTLD